MKKVKLFAAAVALTALALTGCSSKPKETEAPKEMQAKETQAPETQAKETQAPAAETEAAVVETEAPETETEEAADTEEAVVETETEAAAETEMDQAKTIVVLVTETEEETEGDVETEEEAIETESEIVETEEEVIETESEIVETEEEAVETEAETEEETETEEAVETEEEVIETESEIVETEEETAETEEETETEEAVETEAETEEAVETEAETETEAEGEASGVMTYEEYVNAETGTLVTVEAYVQGKQEWYEDNKEVGTDTVTIYAQDKDGGYFFYDVPCSKSDYARLKPGVKIRFTGYKSEWAGEDEIVADDLDSIEILDEKPYLPKAIDVTEIMADEDELYKHLNQKVSFKGMTVEPASVVEEETESAAGGKSKTKAKEAPAFLYGWDGSGSEGDDLYFEASVDGETYSFVIESYLCDKDSDVYKAVENLKVGDKIDMEGFLYWYEEPLPHITSVVVEGAEEE